MRAFVGVTDQDWYDFLKSQPHLDEVNFWQPGGKQQFRALSRGELFLFKLHAPKDFIVGGGIFWYSTLIPINLAWESFKESNGARTLMDMRALIGKFRKEPDYRIADYTIGCILLEQPFFLPETAWIPVPDWNRNIVQGKRYDLSTGPGISIWNQLNRRFTGVIPYTAREGSPRYGEPALVRQRLGQGTFRIMVTDAYGRRCAVTNERTLPALDAAHIKPYSDSGEHAVNNGILLRRDLHALFDQGYVTINPDMKFEVSRKIREEFENGIDYYRLHGAEIRVPDDPLNRPDREYLEWHNTKKYNG